MHQNISGQFALEVEIMDDHELFKSFMPSVRLLTVRLRFLGHSSSLRFCVIWPPHCLPTPSPSHPGHIAPLSLKRGRFVLTSGPLPVRLTLPGILFPQVRASSFYLFQSLLKYPFLKENIPAHRTKISRPCTFHCISPF